MGLRPRRAAPRSTGSRARARAGRLHRRARRRRCRRCSCWRGSGPAGARRPRCRPGRPASASRRGRHSVLVAGGDADDRVCEHGPWSGLRARRRGAGAARGRSGEVVGGQRRLVERLVAGRSSRRRRTGPRPARGRRGGRGATARTDRHRTGSRRRRARARRRTTRRGCRAARRGGSRRPACRRPAPRRPQGRTAPPSAARRSPPAPRRGGARGRRGEMPEIGQVVPEPRGDPVRPVGGVRPRAGEMQRQAGGARGVDREVQALLGHDPAGPEHVRHRVRRRTGRRRPRARRRCRSPPARRRSRAMPRASVVETAGNGMSAGAARTPASRDSNGGVCRAVTIGHRRGRGFGAAAGREGCCCARGRSRRPRPRP